MRIFDGQLQLAATDLSNFLACRHLTRLDTLKSQGFLSPTKQFDIGFQDLIKRGEDHEKRILDLLALRGASPRFQPAARSPMPRNPD